MFLGMFWWEWIVLISFFLIAVEGILMGLVVTIFGNRNRVLSIFNPIDNYTYWKNLNWFGVILFTLLLNIIVPFWACSYWFYKLVTVRRKQ